MFSENIIGEISEAASGLDIEPALLLAVAEVESGGAAFALVGGRREPLIRFEGHYFDRRLTEDKRATARAEGLAAPVAGAVPNPKTQGARWRMLERAAAIDRNAAYESVSWGLGQVMGAHWAWLGYAGVEALAAEARSGIAGQVRLMARYIGKAGLIEALRAHDWPAFARGYNGPAYWRNGYDAKLAAAYRHYSARPPAAAGSSRSAPPLRQGARGEAVSGLQRGLAALGYAVDIDGIFGPATAAAVRRFQTEHGLGADGIVGTRTAVALQDAMGAGGAAPGPWAMLVAWLEKLFGRA